VLKRHGEKQALWYHTCMKKTNPKHEIFVKLQGMIHSEETLRMEIRELTHNCEYTYTDNFYARAALELAALEKRLGVTKEVKELKTLIGARA
jgi:hypothetical protein